MSVSTQKFTLAVTALAAVWASRYGSLRRCILREAAQAGGQPPLLPETPRAALGSAVHRLFERAASDNSFPFFEDGLNAEWAKAVADIETFLSQSPYMEGMLPLSRSIPNIGLIRARTIVRILEGGRPAPLKRAAAEQNKAKSFPGRLTNAAGTVIGIPDRIEFGQSGVAIVDFKTGLTAEKMVASWEDYETQLRLYAALYQITAGKWPHKLELQGLDGVGHDVPFSPAECSALLAEAEKIGSTLQQVTSELASNPQAQLRAASPSQVACRFCAFRPGCGAYVRAAFSVGPLLEWDVVGTFRSHRTFGNGEYLVELDQAGSTTRIRNLPPLAHIVAALDSAVPGQQIMVFNVSHGGEGERLFSPTAFTAVHTYERN